MRIKQYQKVLKNNIETINVLDKIDYQNNEYVSEKKEIEIKHFKFNLTNLFSKICLVCMAFIIVGVVIKGTIEFGGLNLKDAEQAENKPNEDSPAIHFDEKVLEELIKTNNTYNFSEKNESVTDDSSMNGSVLSDKQVETVYQYYLLDYNVSETIVAMNLDASYYNNVNILYIKIEEINNKE